MIPKHIAIIMDGNGRWANARGLPRIHGHREGLKSVHRAVKMADDTGVGYLTLYSFSTENWKRPKNEVSFLMSLIEEQIRAEGKNLHKKNVRVRFIGRRHELRPSLAAIMNETEHLTENNDGLTLIFAINYGGRQEIADAVNRIAASGTTKEITPEDIGNHLYTAGIPDPDLVIRTAGEQRLSNFLIWQASYAEYYFTDVFWPDFDEEEFAKALKEFARRKRKYGGLEKQGDGKR